MVTASAREVRAIKTAGGRCRCVVRDLVGAVVCRPGGDPYKQRLGYQG
ncbi:MAG: hypothetical protein H5U01_10245 [Clostridia bacterium]|nr:hypothetical protein [Clostridia bacterium]